MKNETPNKRRRGRPYKVEDPSNLPNKLREIRTCRGLTGTECASVIGRGAGVISEYENYGTGISLRPLCKLADFLCCDIRDILPHDPA
jgi:transcriptional regulator with XRE-family HTH domain